MTKMMMRLCLIALVLQCGVTLYASDAPAYKQSADMTKPVKVYILLGQSNMLGFGKVSPVETQGTLEYITKTENKYPNIVDEDGTWKMLYTTDGPWGYAHSQDGLHWTKHKDPVVTGFYGGDPYLKKIGENYYAWHSRAHKGHLRIYCRSSPDMIHWKETYNDPQLGYTQPWEWGIGRSEVHWDRHLADAELLEHDGKVLMYYGGAQCPLQPTDADSRF